MEKTVEFLLESQAKTETRLVAITDLLHTGVRMLVNVQEAQRDTERRISALVGAQLRTDQSVKELAEAQKRTEYSLQALLDSLRGRNGH